MNIKSHPLLNDLSEDVVEYLLEKSELACYEDGAVIFRENATAECVYYVNEGSVIFQKSNDDGQNLIVNFCKPGEFFGEIGVLCGQLRSMEATAKGDVRLTRIPAEVFRSTLCENPEKQEVLFSIIFRHLRRTTDNYLQSVMEQERMSVVGQMVNTIVHDLKNPVCIIQLASDLLKMQDGETKVKRLSSQISGQVNRIVNMINDLGEFSQGGQCLQLEKKSMRELLSQFKELNFPFFEKENIIVRIDVPDVEIDCEPEKLMRVFQNLIANAIEAIGEGKGTISVRGKVTNDRLYIEIEDNAGGIPDDIKANFFKPFVTHGKKNGTGLGSAIAKSIVEAHKGQLTFVSQKGIGTIFQINLPLC